MQFAARIIGEGRIVDISRLIVDDADKFFRAVHPIDLAAERGRTHRLFRLLHPVRRTLQLTEYRRGHLHALGQKAVGGIAARGRIRLRRIQRFFQKLPSRLLRISARFRLRGAIAQLCRRLFEESMHEITRIGRHHRRFFPFLKLQPLRSKIAERTAEIAFQHGRRNLAVPEKQPFSAFDAYLPLAFFKIVVPFLHAQNFQSGIQGGIFPPRILAATLVFVLFNEQLADCGGYGRAFVFEIRVGQFLFRLKPQALFVRKQPVNVAEYVA